MAYETTYSGLLRDQEELISTFLDMNREVEIESSYDVDQAEDPQEELESDTPDDYDFYKSYYEEAEAKNSLETPDDDLAFVNFLFEGDNKYNFINKPSTSTFANGNVTNYISMESFKDSIAKRESLGAGGYKAISPNSTARGKYQFIWSIHKDEIAKQTGVSSEKDFLNNPEAQENYFNYWDRTTLSPSANANYEKFKKYYPNASVDDVKRATHFAGRGGLEKALRTGNFTQGIDANNTSIQKYVYGNKR